RGCVSDDTRKYSANASLSLNRPSTVMNLKNRANDNETQPTKRRILTVHRLMVALHALHRIHSELWSGTSGCRLGGRKSRLAAVYKSIQSSVALLVRVCSRLFQNANWN